MKALLVGLVLAGAGYGWVWIEMQHPMIFRLLDDQRNAEIWKANDRALEAEKERLRKLGVPESEIPNRMFRDENGRRI